MKRFPRTLTLLLLLGALLALVAGSAATAQEPVPGTFVPGVVLVNFDRPITDVLDLPPNVQVVDRPDRLDAFGWRLVEVPEGFEDRLIALLAEIGIPAERSSYGVLFVDPNDPHFNDGHQWGPQHINAPGAWDSNKGSFQHTVCVIDSGIAWDHPDLDGKVVFHKSALGDDGYEGFGWYSHGTFVSGIAAAETNNGEGIAGVGWNPSIGTVKFTNGLFYQTEDLIEAINECMNSGADVINMSLGSPTPSQALDDALTAAENAGLITVSAAGNSNDSNPRYPCAYSDLCAAATDNTDSFTRWTNYGNTVNMATPGGQDVDLGDPYGPGDIWSTWLNHDTMELTYTYFRGTSFSCPHVSGAATVLLNNSGATRQSVVQAILDTAKPVSGYGKWVTHGFLDMQAAQEALEPKLEWRLRLNLQTLQGATAGLHQSDTGNYIIAWYSEWVPGQGYGPWKQVPQDQIVWDDYYWCNIPFHGWLKFYKQPDIVIETDTDVTYILWDITTLHRRGTKNSGCVRLMFQEGEDTIGQDIAEPIKTIDWPYGDTNQSW